MGDQTEQALAKPAGESSTRTDDLPLVGPATAAALEGASFDAADIAERRVSYVMLREAGINPGVAARMRRRYSLVWSFRWRFGGDDLPDRAAQVRGFQPPERSWVDESGRPVTTPEDEAITAWNDWVEGSFADAEDEEPPKACPRCGSLVVTYSLGDRERVHCEACGYAAVSLTRDGANHERQSDDTEQSWVAVLEQFRRRLRNGDAP